MYIHLSMLPLKWTELAYITSSNIRVCHQAHDFSEQQFECHVTKWRQSVITVVKTFRFCENYFQRDFSVISYCVCMYIGKSILQDLWELTNCIIRWYADKTQWQRSFLWTKYRHLNIEQQISISKNILLSGYFKSL